ncbi:MAG: CHRD domain-containing protein [Gammaproteobacteria bacterium]|nr:CHRD domain-containing protein [Gammaproteobacteria bacterium]NND38403.1 CHRD domain-containing protein [Pseudomonadales bacterium]RZV58845.1 MAG: CHRD domain-containing protein [Pseudomonadales bacterium]
MRRPTLVGISPLSVALLFLLLVPSLASAAIVNLSATIDGAQANAGNGTGSSATGSAAMTLDDQSNLFSWEIQWTSLASGETVAHFHGPAMPNQNGGVELNIGIANPANGSAFLSSGQATDLLNGLWYINIHSNNDPGGEIRGQVNVVPIPAAVWLFGTALLGMMGLAKRKAI